MKMKLSMIFFFFFINETLINLNRIENDLNRMQPGQEVYFTRYETRNSVDFHVSARNTARTDR